jgi:SAM-dependent methyltransferase
MTPRRLSMKDALAEVLQPRDKTVIDAGCGGGEIVRHLALLGADAIGIEISEAQLQGARTKIVANESYLIGRGESLPCDDASADAILYLKSFHHMPVEAMAPALLDATRVLRNGGQLVVIEPIAEGPYFEATRPIEDETEVRAAAYAALQKPPQQLRPEGEFVYESLIRFRDADRFLQAVVAPDPARRERLPQVEAEMRRRFATYSQKDTEGFFFFPPMRRHLFRKSL